MAIEEDVYKALRNDPKLRNKVFEAIREATSAHPMYADSVQGKTDYSIDLHPAADSQLTARQLQIVHLAQPLYQNGRLVKNFGKELQHLYSPELVSLQQVSIVMIRAPKRFTKLVEQLLEALAR